ncbi:hypothetical protein FOPE_06366 [Fonsecaea pedrosoi]|nr:hypothetical protein FOPE_06366 [Fonsecaea pedrosoi]
MADRNRSLSGRTSSTGLKEDSTSASSEKSTLSLANYRLIVLDRARIVVRHAGLPEPVQSRIKTIISAEVSHECKNAISSITDTLCAAFAPVLKVASRGDDCVELIYDAIASMNIHMFGQKFIFRRKADWISTLKPKVRRKYYHFPRLAVPLLPESHGGMKNSDDGPKKQHLAETASNTPDGAGAALPPCPPVPEQEASGIKTPRPDVTIGFDNSVVSAELRKLGLGEADADDLLKVLQDQEDLYSDPTQSRLHTRFPSFVIEGKSYATGKNLYEAQNQAAVSGCMMLVIQHQLHELNKLVSSGTHQGKEPLAFSLCSEGPVMELWVHYTTSTQDMRTYNMHLLKICHASCRETVGPFVAAVAAVLMWANSELLVDITKLLHSVWKAAQ